MSDYNDAFEPQEITELKAKVLKKKKADWYDSLSWLAEDLFEALQMCHPSRKYPDAKEKRDKALDKYSKWRLNK